MKVVLLIVLDQIIHEDSYTFLASGSCETFMLALFLFILPKCCRYIDVDDAGVVVSGMHQIM